MSDIIYKAKVRDKNKSEWLYIFSKHWFLLFSIFYGLYVGLPFLAPILMKLGWELPANMIYKFYSFLCHQMPQRSFFMYGPKRMYSLNTIQTVWENTTHPMILRKFIGNPDLGWKVAWSDRMVSLYTGILFTAWVWYPFRKKIKSLSILGFGLFAFPMAVDGITHFISDFAGIGSGFRDSNLWLAKLTNFSFSNTFYMGDGLGSFNSWMRLITGILFSIGFVWLAFPIIETTFQDIVNKFQIKYEKLENLRISAIREIIDKS